ncbi:multidrug DMT transporter [Acinetobacter ursingii]|uniref:DNA circularization N-terminal domain-containing protein n=1 Tax=Acinetobacter ursingii TaxID=108980 RepID=UPI000F773680|nr:DNA circularization N-terminal domain-containing protein [Acinetobacter ursingii]RSO86140.1 multidrug DMT transporter [Acinetobacter ursingii]
MGWKDDLLDSSFRGVQFACISTKDSVSKTQVVHQAPYSNEAIIEDMGKEPRKITIQTIYTGEDYKSQLDALENALQETGEGELIHPIFGSCNASVITYSVDHDADNYDACLISIDFILAKEEKRELFLPIDAPIAIDGLVGVDAPFAKLREYLNKLRSFDPNKYLQVFNRIRNGIQDARTALGLIKGTIEDVLNPKWITGLIDDVTKLVTFDTSISAISKWRDVFHRIKRLSNIFDSDDDAPELKQTWRAVQVATTVAVSQKMVSRVRDEMIQQTQEQHDQIASVVTNNNSNGIVSGSANKNGSVSGSSSSSGSSGSSGGGSSSSSTTGQTSSRGRTRTEVSLTPLDLAVIRQNIRQQIQENIQAEREQSSATNLMTYESVNQIQLLKVFADQVHLQIQELIETRPPITTAVVPVPCTLHWFAHYLYGDMSRANEINRLNQNLINPAMLLSGMELTVYAR